MLHFSLLTVTSVGEGSPPTDCQSTDYWSRYSSAPYYDVCESTIWYEALSSKHFPSTHKIFRTLNEITGEITAIWIDSQGLPQLAPLATDTSHQLIIVLNPALFDGYIASGTVTYVV